MRTKNTYTKEEFENAISNMLIEYFNNIFKNTDKNNNIIQELNLREESSDKPININDIGVELNCKITLPSDINFPIKYNPIGLSTILNNFPNIEKNSYEFFQAIMDKLVKNGDLGLCRFKINDTYQYVLNVYCDVKQQITQYTFKIEHNIFNNISPHICVDVHQNTKPVLKLSNTTWCIPLINNDNKSRKWLPLSKDLLNYIVFTSKWGFKFERDRFFNLLKKSIKTYSK